jgi:hypothetical protein
VSDEETYYRDSFDLLLEFYSLVELGIRSGVFQDPLPNSFVALAENHLSDPALRAYYSSCYPLLLPRLLRLRIQRRPVADEKNEARSEFFRYLDLRKWMTKDDRVWRTQLPNSVQQTADQRSDDQFYESLLKEPREDVGKPWPKNKKKYRTTLDEEIRASYAAPWGEFETFLSFLDGYGVKTRRGWIGIDDVVAVLSKPAVFVSRMQREPEERTPLDSGLWGLLEFLRWCSAYRKFLDSISSSLLRSAYWHANSYWFATLQEWQD